VTDQPLEPREAGPEPSGPEPPEPELQPEPEPTPDPEPEATSTTTTTATAPAATSRKLYRSRDDQVIAGVCGGLGDYFDIDSTLFRIGFVLLVFAGGAGILAYGLAWIFIPEAPVEGPYATAAETPPGREQTSGAVIVGLVFVVLGAFFLFDEVWPDFLSWKYVWPIALIAVGVAILARRQR
jgi:phage shock protein C